MPFMPPTASFVAEVAEPPPPLIVPLAHTDFVKPVFPSLLMHEDLGDNPIAPKNQAPKNQAPKTNVSKKMVSFLRPSRPRTSSRDYEDLTLSQISLVVPVGGASHVKDADFAILTGWTTDFIVEFVEAVGKLVAEKFKPEFSLSDQDPEAKAELETEVLRMYPCVDAFAEHWPLEKVLIRACKNSAAKEAKRMPLSAFPPSSIPRNLRTRK
ncbi:hypothetical protein C8R47DRAFT_1274501 [Mycena vitilis]|nr:hypothetical protein C8R47DRAFT_1269982 [Mycena vitilis]KAJ6489311.1 hypothetical protein C8R47DRAFT_1274501 [Mycena vitilis]